jgi:CspA family cold shock protein
MAKGTIRRLTDRGFGFINTGEEKDLFFHRNTSRSQKAKRSSLR